MQNPDLILSNYDFDLPAELIADRPVEGRHNSKLLVYHASTDTIEHRNFFEISDILSEDHLLVLNQSKVFPCRLFGTKPSGGKSELFLLSLLYKDNIYPAMIRCRGKKSIGDTYLFDDLQACIESINEDGSFGVSFNVSHNELLDLLHSKAQIPIPPYIRSGIADEKDLTDYQTVYAKEVGSVAAPTAGLHFTDSVFKSLSDKGIKKAFVTLHVGAGTFKPVTCENILEHKMHAEFFDIDEENLKLIQENKKIIAVGTTTLRTLESAYHDGMVQRPSQKPQSTDIFLYPGKEVHSIAGLITNFHLPKSTLLMLVSSLVGREKALELYKEAIANKYRFFSYGDSMLILR